MTPGSGRRVFWRCGAAAEWHPTKNAPLTPADVAAMSDRPRFWQCRNNPAHEWRASWRTSRSPKE